MDATLDLEADDTAVIGSYLLSTTRFVSIRLYKRRCTILKNGFSQLQYIYYNVYVDEVVMTVRDNYKDYFMGVFWRGRGTW